MGKRIFALFTACFILMFQIVAYADIVWKPDDNDFYTLHKNDCKYVGRSYYANGVSGFVPVKTAPNSNTEISKIYNGNTMLIQYTYNYNGEQWGVLPDDDQRRSGWVPMSQLALKYDYLSFEEDHKSEFYTYKGNYNSLKTAITIVLWTWPGSGEITRTLDMTQHNYLDKEFTFQNFSFSKTYKDRQGREWGFVGYWFGNQDAWICINDPTNAKIPAFNPAPQLKLIKPTGNNFISQSESTTEQLDRRFYINGPSSYITPKEEPGSEKEILIREYGKNSKNEVLSYKNGEIVYIAHTRLLSGKYWGCTPCSPTYPSPGWIPMDQLLILYERQDFEAENKGNLYTYTGSYDAVFAAKQLVLWEWPGSDREKRIIDDKSYILKNVDTLYAYKDSQGREWGYVNLSYTYQGMQTSTSMRKGWICLTDPSNSDIPAFNPAPKPIQWSPDGTFQWTDSEVTNDGVEQNSLSNIDNVRTYEQNKTFTDVLENAWYKEAVATAFEYGIIDGMGNDKFDPDGTLTGAEALTIASRIHAYYKYGKEEGAKKIDEYNKSNKNWWDGSVAYCKTELISDDKFDNYLQISLNRAQMVHVWSKILQQKDMAKQNTVVTLPDVSADTPYFEDIILFYEAGIIGGVDANGTFNPDGRVTRAEAATIFMNMIDANKRHSGRTYGSAH